MLIRATSFAFLALALPLVGCGGSSGSGAPETSMEQLPSEAGPVLTAVVADSRPETAAQAATSIPSPGSVTQSSNVDSATNTTVDRVSVTLDPNNEDFTIVQNAAGTAPWEVSTRDAQELSGIPGNGIALVDREENGQRIVIAFARAPEEGNTDWQAAGIWAFVPDSEQAADYEFGAFADGGNPFPDDNLVALTGSATYDGPAFGVYYVDAPDGGEAAPFGASVSLTADFGDADAPGSISGTVDEVVTSSGRLEATLDLELAVIGTENSGFFTGTTSMEFEGRDYAGQWGGQFFGDGTAAPSAVAGTFGATTSTDGATGSLVGAFGAERQAGQ